MNKNNFHRKRSKREESVHKYYYDLFDCSLDHSNWYQGRVFSKEEANNWCKHGYNRSYHEKLLCTLPDMRCSEHCGNTVRDK